MAKVQDAILLRALQKRKTSTIIPSIIVDNLLKTQSQVVEELRAQKEYLLFLNNSPGMTNIFYRIETSRKRITELREGAVQVHLALKEARFIQIYLEEQNGEPEDKMSAQQRLAELGEVAGILGNGKSQDAAESKESVSAMETQSAEVPIDLGLITRLAGCGIRVGPMQFRLIAGQLERTYMNIVRITTDKEDSKKFVRGVKKFFLPPGRSLPSVGITERWLSARGFDAKEIKELLS